MAGEIKLKRRQHRSLSEWAFLVDESYKSGLPIRKFCGERDICPAMLYKWRERLKTKEPGHKPAVSRVCDRMIVESPAFVPVKIVSEEPPPDKALDRQARINSRFILQSSGGVKIEFPGGCIAAELRLVLEALSC